MELIKSALFAKIESSYNSDPTPVAATDVLEIFGQPAFEPVTDLKEKTIPISTFGKLAPLVVGKMYKISGIKVPLKGSGSAGTVPRIGCLLRACGMTQTISAGVSVTYAVHSTLEGESVTLYFWLGGTKHIMTGCVGTWKLPLEANAEMMLEFELTGMYGGTIADVTFPTPTFETTERLIWRAANFKTTVASSEVTLYISKFDLDLGNAISERPDPNGAYGLNRLYISNRESKISFDPEKEALATFNPYTLHTAQTLIDFETKPTGSAGNLVEIVAADYSLDAPKSGSRNNVLTWDLSLQARPTTAGGNNEVSIVFK